VRNLRRTTALLHQALGSQLLEPAQLQLISAYQANVALNWVFSRFMQPWGAPEDVNRLQNIFLVVLNDLGQDLAQRFFRDQMRWADYHRMVLGMFWRYPQIVLIAWRVLGLPGVRQWIGDYLAYSCAAMAAWCVRRLGPGGRAALALGLGRAAPALGLRVAARFAEWRAMGWM
jgi:lycopene cyclase CruA